MLVQIEIDLSTAARLQIEADKRGLSVDKALRRMLDLIGHSATTPEKVRILHEQRMCDADIAAELNYSIPQIAKIRRDLGLPANRKFVSAKSA